MHAVMLRTGTAETVVANSVKPSVIGVFLSDKTPTIWYLKASSDTAIIEQDMLVDIPFIADWKKIEEHRQPTKCNTDHGNKS